MRFNPLFFLLNSINFTHYFMKLTKLPGAVGKFFYNIAMFSWFIFSWLAIPVPAKLTLYIGKALELGKGETAEGLADRARCSKTARQSFMSPSLICLPQIALWRHCFPLTFRCLPLACILDRAAMQKLIDTHQPGGKNYLNALRERFQAAVPSSA
jgi:hypothetical protein